MSERGEEMFTKISGLAVFAALRCGAAMFRVKTLRNEPPPN